MNRKIKLNKRPEYGEKLSIGGLIVTMSGIDNRRFNTSGEPKNIYYKCKDSAGSKYRFILFEDMTVSKVVRIDEKGISFNRQAACA